ncbi:MAG TPA: endo alpha-1,4 polygalactosaminidase [Kofleriaceae bacterium]|jgi:hypothetical protein|nr:endo alpha-1,4 polygalactosaminidase [Kofleriaceae bacterium]
MKAGNLAANFVTANMVATVATLVPAIVSPSLAEANCASAGCPAPVACNQRVGACWHPPVETRWQYQLQAARNASGTACLFPKTGGINVDITAMPVRGGHRVAPQVFDIDFQTDSFCTGGTITQENFHAVKAIHKNGAKAICYVDAGTAENFRPDFPAYAKFNDKHDGALFGNPVSDFPSEFWLNINNNVGQRDFILHRVSERLDRCVDVGFDAVEFDNVDAWENDTGLEISADTQLVFNSMLANLAHHKGLTVGLKNDVEQLGELKPYFDFAINEQCFEFDECDDPPPGLPAWPDSGKAVFNVEYQRRSLDCRQAAIWNFNSILKSVDLFDEPWKPCR